MPPMETDLSYKVFVVVRSDRGGEGQAGERLPRRLRASGEAGDSSRAAGRGRHLDRAAAADLLHHDLLCPDQAALPHISMSRSAAIRSRACATCCPSRRCFSTSTAPWSMKGRRRSCSWSRRWAPSGICPACPIPSIRTTQGVHESPLSYAEDMAALPPPDFDGLPLEKYFVPTKVLPYLATRGCYWGRCEFCDHGEGYTAGYRSKKIQDVLAEIKYLKDKYGAGISISPTNPIRRPCFESSRAAWSKRRWTSSGRPTCGSRRACSTRACGRMRSSPAAAICTSATNRATSGC